MRESFSIPEEKQVAALLDLSVNYRATDYHADARALPGTPSGYGETKLEAVLHLLCRLIVEGHLQVVESPGPRPEGLVFGGYPVIIDHSLPPGEVHLYCGYQTTVLDAQTGAVKRIEGREKHGGPLRVHTSGA